MNKKNVWIIIFVLFAVSVGSTIISVSQMYRISLSKEKLRLVQMLNAHVTLIEAVARFDVLHNDNTIRGGASAATLSQVVDGLSHLKGFGRSGEFLLGKKQKDQIIFLYSDRQAQWGLPAPMAFQEGGRAKPMKEALNEKSGELIGRDYRRVMVLAAFAPVKNLNLGLVAKIDLAEIRSPFVRTAIVSFGLLVFLIVIGALLITHITNPLIRRFQDQAATLEEKELRSRSVIDTAVEGIVTIDAQGKIESFNPAAEKLFGYKSAEVVGQKINLLQPPPINQEHDQYLKHYLKTGEKKIIGIGREVEGKHKNGQLIPLHLSVSEVKLADRRIFTGILRDISQEKKSQKTLQALTDRLQLASRSAQIGIWDWNVVENKLVWDDQMYVLYGIGPEQFEGAYETWQNGVYPQDLAESEKAVQAALGGEKDFDTEFRVVWPNGEIHNLKAYASVQRDAAGRALRMIGVNWDITDQKESEKMLHLAKEQAEAADHLKSAFLASMSHELRTPLNSIIGFTGIILQEIVGALNEEQNKQLNMVQNSANHLLSLINDILDLSKIEAGQLKVEKTPFDYQKSLQTVINTIIPLAEKKGIDIVSESVPAGFNVLGDFRRVEQVLINLITNAIKFTQAGKVSISSTVENKMLVIAIIDTGIGIAPEDIDSIFDKFRQVETTLSKKYEGTGLGLAICQSLVEMMGGKIRAESPGLGKGSKITFTIPIAPKGG
jgi:two-component system, sensor histidine kinase and response regulator